MYLRPDEVARELENSVFERDTITRQSYGYRKGHHYVYVNREARLGRTALVVHPSLRDKSSLFADPTSPVRASVSYQAFPPDPEGQPDSHYGIPHGFSSRAPLARYLQKMFN
ncbi:DUF2002 family protein [Candidatus Sodalis endolongispinus]|uniref:DUF2002 family protein n=1 Tax=Candidatus Sodalis endolongispinus TaxID=2812662 RepID=A0ABS5Y9Q0_9GAMM|nr:DUF2002 family protein [Candidatus Sodalis endolongispinus]MBT9431662.1 DUF2002 family protein [Candidatus Sodalis endolongispinus]